MALPFDEFCDLVIVASKKAEEEKLRQQWVALLPFMAMQWLKFMPFEQYADRCRGNNIDRRPESEIISEILELHGLESL